MSLTLISSPIKTVNTILSDVVSTVQHLFNFKREDFEITEVLDDSGDAQLIIAIGEGDVSSQFTAGDQVYFDDGGAEYTPDVYSVKAVTFSTNTKVTLDLAFSSDTTGYINLLTRQKYHLEMEVYEETATTLAITFPIIFAPNQEGVIKADLAPFILGHMRENSLQSFIYAAKYREAYIGLTPPAQTTIADIQAIDSTLSILHEGGSNMWDFLLDSNISKFLTKFSNPVLWGGWKREIGYVIDSDFDGGRKSDDPHSLFRYLDQNRVFISNSDDTNRVPDKGIYSLPLEVAAIPATAFFIDAKLVDDTTGALIWTETLEYQILTECKNPIMLEWLNTLGHYEQHLFEMNQQVNDLVNVGSELERAVLDDIDSENNLVGRVQGELREVIIMGDQDLTRNQLQALREIKSSPDVRLFLAKDGSSFVNVQVGDIIDTIFDTDNTLHEIQIDIRLPKNFNFFESKEY